MPLNTDMECLRALDVRNESYNLISCNTHTQTIVCVGMGPIPIDPHLMCIVVIDKKYVGVLRYAHHTQPLQIDPYSVHEIRYYARFYYNRCHPDEMVAIYNALLLIKKKGGCEAITLQRLYLNNPVKMFYFPELYNLFSQMLS
jgi:hypothetical protein